MSIVKSPVTSCLLTALSGGVLCAGIVFMVGVLERWGAAVWIAYKFSGFSPDGFITLSARTACEYITVAIALLVLSCLILVLSLRKNLLVASLLSRYAAIVFLVAIVLYIALGFSPLNQWRP